MHTYIGGLHSPPVSQTTTIHQDIQLQWGEEAVTWVSGRGNTQDPHGTGGPPDRHPLERLPHSQSLSGEDVAPAAGPSRGSSGEFR